MKPNQIKELLLKTTPSHLPVMLVGAPGIGKSDIVAQVAQELNAKLIISHPVVSDPTEYKGQPFVLNMDSENPQATFLPYTDLQELIEADSLTIYFLDDLGQAPPAVQAAAMQLILARRINGHRVSEHVTFIAATNRKQDKAGVSGILEPVKSRFVTIIHMEPDLEDWVNWALKNDMPTELIAFLRFRPNLLFDFQPTTDMKNSPSPRTNANVGRLFNMGIPEILEYETYAGAAGEGHAAEFLGFLKVFRELPNPDLVLMNPDTANVPEEPATLYAICGALARKASEQTINRVIRYANRLPAEFSVLLVKDAVQIAPEIVNTRPFIQWASDHADVLL